MAPSIPVEPEFQRKRQRHLEASICTASYISLLPNTLELFTFSVSQHRSCLSKSEDKLSSAKIES